MIQRGGEVVVQMLSNVKQATIAPVIQKLVLPGTLIFTDEYSIYARITEWGYGHKTVNHGQGDICLRRGWGRFLRSSCEYDGRLLVLTSVLVQTAPRNFSSKVTLVSELL